MVANGTPAQWHHDPCALRSDVATETPAQRDCDLCALRRDAAAGTPAHCVHLFGRYLCRRATMISGGGRLHHHSAECCHIRGWWPGVLKASGPGVPKATHSRLLRLHSAVTGMRLCASECRKSGRAVLAEHFRVFEFTWGAQVRVPDPSCRFWLCARSRRPRMAVPWRPMRNNRPACWPFVVRGLARAAGILSLALCSLCPPLMPWYQFRVGFVGGDFSPLSSLHCTTLRMQLGTISVKALRSLRIGSSGDFSLMRSSTMQ